MVIFQPSKWLRVNPSEAFERAECTFARFSHRAKAAVLMRGLNGFWMRQPRIYITTLFFKYLFLAILFAGPSNNLIHANIANFGELLFSNSSRLDADADNTVKHFASDIIDRSRAAFRTRRGWGR